MNSTNLIDYSYYKSTKDKGNYNLYRLVKKINFLLEKKEGFVVLKNFQINTNNLKITKIRYENFLKNFGKLEIQNKKKSQKFFKDLNINNLSIYFDDENNFPLCFNNCCSSI